ncbi:MAG: LLM class F420-dependent oxidoreductase [Deltaproteobacteria bacterium]|nr:LLM class F420-dependent oxidoreductase [Deltaproteobacteria bacterium]MBW2243271.1 LLM class F420-dependent oxidoreductase [Deltaproteobacteria bacterium]MBW2385748.1 LLM class F420-dependent oxidoreductase [Deltaproteobacteria bacterium]
MKVGIVYPQPEIKGNVGAISTIARAVEERGFDHLLVFDHVLAVDPVGRDAPLIGPYTEADPFSDPLSIFAYLAGITERIQLMSGVLILPQRQTPLVARQAADVDLLSGGRLILGVGLGWNYVECEALGVDFTTRGVRCAEQIELLRRLWSGELISYDGRFERAERVQLNPPPRRQIPVWIGGSAPQATERAGRLADGFIGGGPIEYGLEAKAAVDASRAEHGRADEEFGYTFQTSFSRSEDEAVAAAEKWRDAGGTHVSISTMGMGSGTSVGAHLDCIARIADRLGVCSP